MSEDNARAGRDERVTFRVGGIAIVGILRIPAGSAVHPGIVLEGPLTSVKEQVTGNYAEALRQRGFVTLAFDHRHFGESGGEPRQLEHPERKVEDLRGAVEFLLDRPEVAGQYVGAVGICAGAGYLAGAVVTDDRIRAWGTVAGFFHDASKQRQWMGDTYGVALDRARRARELYQDTGKVEIIPAVGQGDVAMPLDEAFQYYGTERGAVPNYKHEFAVMSREHTLTWDAQIAAKRIEVPTLMIHSENALGPDLARQFFADLGGIKREVWTESSGQIDFYDDPAKIGFATDLLAEHFREHLQVPDPVPEPSAAT